MNQKLVDAVVNAMLYKGHILYPYRGCVKTNQPRLDFGRVYPQQHYRTENDAEPSSLQTQCLVEGGPLAHLNVTIRFLHPMTRDIGALAAPLQKMPVLDNPDFFHVVPELEIDGTLYSSWLEAVERPFPLPMLTMTELCEEETRVIPFSFPMFRSIEPVMDKRDRIAGVIVRRQEELEGVVELSGERLDDKIFKITVRIVNHTSMPSGVIDDNDEIAMRTFAATHAILHTPHAQFLSLIDPPAAYVQAAAGCENVGMWPILAGDETKKERDTMISSPILLCDYPKIAQESSGDLGGADEIEEIPASRIKPELRNLRQQDLDVRPSSRNAQPARTIIPRSPR